MDLDVRIHEKKGGLWATVKPETGSITDTAPILLTFPLEKRSIMEVRGSFDGVQTSSRVYKQVRDVAEAHSDEAYAPFLEAER